MKSNAGPLSGRTLQELTVSQMSRNALFQSFYRHGVIDEETLKNADTFDQAGMIDLCHHIADVMLTRRSTPVQSEGLSSYQRLDQAMVAVINRLRAHPNAQPHLDELDQISFYAEEAFARMAPTLEKRCQQGFCIPVGDVEEGDICLELVSICCDILILDSLSHANEVVDRYLEGCGDFGMMRLFDYAAVYYALLRAEAAADDPQALQQFIEAIIYIYEFRIPYLLLGVGVIGSGKSRFTRSAMRELAGIRVRSNVERRRLMEQRKAQGLPELELHSDEMTELTYQHMARITGALLEASYPVYIDATCLKRFQRSQLRDQAQYRGLAVAMVHFMADRETLEERIERRSQKQDQDTSHALAILHAQLNDFEPFEADEKIHLIQLDTSEDQANETLVGMIREHLRISNNQF